MDEIVEGDLVITLAKVEKIRAIVDKLHEGQIGVVTSISSKFAGKLVYGVLIDGQEYFLFSDEVQKMEEEC
tara:strand:- start:452 stop:664 length:213 start_codon:yes stop_codon:yes gene_type:complete